MKKNNMGTTADPAVKMYWKDGFYDEPVEGGAEITQEYWQELLEGQCDGKVIVTGADGMPCLSDKPHMTLEQAKQAKIDELQAYDHSRALNSFSLNGIGMWLDKNTRMSIAYSLENIERAGGTLFRLWTVADAPQAFDVPLGQMKEILSQLETYSKRTFDTTQSHKVAIGNLGSQDEVEAYDISSGYPARLEFLV